MAKKSTKTVTNENITEASVATDAMAEATENEVFTNNETNTAAETVMVEPITYNTVIATVISYDKYRKRLALNIDGYGVMLDNVQDYNGTDTYIVKYTGTIGEADCRIISDVC